MIKLDDASKKKYGIISLISIGGILLILCLYFALRQESLQTAAENIHQAIQSRNTEVLNQYIDYEMVAVNLANAVIEVNGDTTQNVQTLKEKLLEEILFLMRTGKPSTADIVSPRHEEQDPIIQKAMEINKEKPKEVQLAIAKALQQELSKKREENNPHIKDDEWQETSFAPKPDALPDDFVNQLIAMPLAVARSDGDIGILETAIQHPDLGGTIPIKFVLSRDEKKKWRMIGIGNAKELAALYRKAMDKWRSSVSGGFKEDNERRTTLMNRYYNIIKCHAFLAKTSGKQDYALVVTLDGVNGGKEKVMTAGMICHLHRPNNDEILASVPLNSSRNLQPGETFGQRWQIDLPNELPETQKLINARTFECRVDVSSVSLGNGRFIFERSQEDLDTLLK